MKRFAALFLAVWLLLLMGLRSFAAAGAGMWGGELVVRPAG